MPLRTNWGAGKLVAVVRVNWREPLIGRSEYRGLRRRKGPTNHLLKV
jgi:hypothetical protein